MQCPCHITFWACTKRHTTLILARECRVRRCYPDPKSNYSVLRTQVIGLDPKEYEMGKTTNKVRTISVTTIPKTKFRGISSDVASACVKANDITPAVIRPSIIALMLTKNPCKKITFIFWTGDKLIALSIPYSRCLDRILALSVFTIPNDPIRRITAMAAISKANRS
jgi:hypothetical protein